MVLVKPTKSTVVALRVSLCRRVRRSLARDLTERPWAVETIKSQESCFDTMVDST